MINPPQAALSDNELGADREASQLAAIRRMQRELEALLPPPPAATAAATAEQAGQAALVRANAVGAMLAGGLGAAQRALKLRLYQPLTVAVAVAPSARPRRRT